MADEVMRMPAPEATGRAVSSVLPADTISRMCADCEEETVRRKSADSAANPATPDIFKAITRLGSGSPLPSSERNFFEPRFGRDFSNVRVHTDQRAGGAAQAINARAFTLGNNVAFGAGQFRPGTSPGRRLLAHELTHVVQQPSTHNEVIRREITEDSIRGGDFYSTNCGWVDAGHSNPGDARILIAQVREASQRVGRREDRLTRTVAAERTPLVREDDCDATYERDEARDSHAEAPLMETTEHASGAVETILGGFGVDSPDASKFDALIAAVADAHAAWETFKARSFSVEVLGFGDCIGNEEGNNVLRLGRAFKVSSALAKHGLQVTASLGHEMTEYLASNATREGRKKNRGALIRFIPQVTPETFTTDTAESRFTGIQVSAVTPTVRLNRSLSEGEVLSVALSIFSALSQVFEAHQRWRDAIPSPFPSSSFAEEDLPSNLIGFYRAARGYSFEEVRTLCGAWSEPRSIAHLAGYNFQPNHSFHPNSLPTGGAWPHEFQSIVPEPFDSEAFQIVTFRLETPFVAFNCSIDPATSTLRCP
ncbi:MAG: DUF4157 domain-containing protein [Pseudomonadota bacterium]